MTTVEPRSVQVGDNRYPLVLPSLTDARFHIALVTITLHVLGQTVLGFRVSIPQILVAILAPAVVEFVHTFRSSGAIVWPASAMLTGSGVALIFRVVGTEAGDHWSWLGWHLFALVAVGSLLTKYLITYRGGHVFNPSNVGLVVAFLVLGSHRVEPLDFWWAPMTPGMLTAYLVIVAGGLAITGRLRLAMMGLAFWMTLAGGMGLLAVSGHCMTAAWAPQAVCGAGFWWTVLTSPEVAIFLFFMITDPRTVPVGRTARLAFAVCVGIVSTLLIAPQSTEFGAKVGLLAGLTIMSPIRYGIEGLFAAPGRGLTVRKGVPVGVPALLARGMLIGSAVVGLGAAVVLAGIPARPAVQDIAVPAVETSIDPASLPEVEVRGDVSTLLGELTADGLAVMLAEDLAIENAAMVAGDQRLLLAAATGARLADVERTIDLAVSDGVRVVTEFEFESLTVRSLERDGSQAGAAIAVDATGSSVTITSDPGGTELSRSNHDVALTFVMRQGSDGRWLIADTLTAAD